MFYQRKEGGEREREKKFHQIEKFYLYFFFSVKLMARIHFDENISAYTIGHHFILSKSNSIEPLLDVDDDGDGVVPNREWQSPVVANSS